jgi:hypothetical protein
MNRRSALGTLEMFLFGPRRGARAALLIPAFCAILCAQDAPLIAPQASPAGTIVIQGHVTSSDGSRVSGATVTIAGASSSYVAVTNSDTDPGKYSSPAIRPGTYTITARKEGYRPQPPQTVTLSMDGQLDFVLDAACSSCSEQVKPAWGWATLFVVALFFGSICLVRWHNIARPNRALLTAEIDDAEARFQNETGISMHDPRVSYLKELLFSARKAIEWNWRSASSWFDFFFWTRGQEITGWSRIHEFQRSSINLLATASPLDTIRARLQAIMLDLLDLEKTHAKTFAANIKDALAEQPPNTNSLRALLVEALTYLNDQTDNAFAQLTGWQTKAIWLTGVGCSLIVVLTFGVGNPVLFIAGAAGGYLSRLSRALKRADVPTDYGASWTTLFLSPIVGALSGWFGILLIVVLADNKFQVLGAAFHMVKWYYPNDPVTLGMAFLLGFSEQLFDKIIASLEKKVDSDRQAATKGSDPGGGGTAPPKGAPSPSVRQQIIASFDPDPQTGQIIVAAEKPDPSAPGSKTETEL